MHPREGWTERRAPARRGLSRRSFLQPERGRRAAGGGAGPLLAACGLRRPGPAGWRTAAIPLPRPDHPVTWPIFTDNKPITSGLQPEQGATLQIYNWVAYINQQCLKNFAKKYNCKVQLTTFNTMDEAIAKLRTRAARASTSSARTVDVHGPAGRGEADPAAQPQLHPEHRPGAGRTSPTRSTTGHWQYTVPYTIYTTGIAWRKDHVPENPYTMANPWAMPWQAKYKGKVAILDDYRESISLGLMKNGIFDLNTTSPTRSPRPRQALQELVQPDQRAHRQQRLHRGPQRPDLDPPRLVGRHGRGRLLHAQGRAGRGRRLLVPHRRQRPGRQRHHHRPAVGDSPVLAHLFLNYLLDLPNVLTNISFNGYMQPLDRGHAAAAGQGEAPAAEPDVHRRPALLLPARASCELQLPVATDAAVAAGLAARRATGSSGMQPSTERARAAARPQRRAAWQPHRLFWAALAAPGHHLAGACCSSCRSTRCSPIAGGRLNQLFEHPVAVWNPLHWSSANLVSGVARPRRRGRVRRPDRHPDARLRRRRLGAVAC